MRFLQIFQLAARWLLLLNALLLLALLAAAILFFSPGGWRNLVHSQGEHLQLQRRLDHESLRISRILQAELAAGQSDVETLAGVTSHIYTHPDSFRLAAQPGEYDYEKETNLYSSARSEENAGLVVSAATTLTPELLRDIQLSEYLVPFFRDLVKKRPACRRITLLTAESLMVSVPWFDFPGQVKAGRWKRDFSASDFDWFSKSAPDKNSSRIPLWSRGSLENPAGKNGLLCAAPFFAEAQFKGVLVLELDPQSSVSSLFAGEAFSREAIFWLDSPGNLWAANGAALSALGLPPDSPFPHSLESLAGRSSSFLPGALSRESQTGGDLRVIAGFFLISRDLKPLPGKLTLMVSNQELVDLADFTGSNWYSRLKTGMAATLTVLGITFLLNLLWVLSARKQLQTQPRQLAESLAMLEDLEKEREKIRAGHSDIGEVYQRFDHSLEKVRQSLASLQTGAGAEYEGVRELKSSSSELGLCQEQVQLLLNLSVLDPLDASLARLSQQLCDFFSATNTIVLFYSSTEKQLQSYQHSQDSTQPGSERIVFRVFDDSIFSRILSTGLPQAADLSTLLKEDLEATARVATENLLAGPLHARKEAFALVLLADKKGGWDSRDLDHLKALQDILSRVVATLLQIERGRKIDLLRREYCQELSRAVEMPLHHIQEEVQAIHNRLGRLTPYFKEHCEAILFEVGVLFQVAQEAREQETGKNKGG